MRFSLSSLLDRALPAPPPKDHVAFLTAQPFAHRGLHGGGVVENSRAAFRAAIALGHGIELDIQMSADGIPFVFHDTDLSRLTGETGLVAGKCADDLCAIHLKGSAETIPSLEEVLELVAGQVPLLIEIKPEAHPIRAACMAVRRALEGYQGNAAVMSFNPLVGRWFHDYAARIPRGQVMTETGDANKRGFKKAREGFAARRLLRQAYPQFLAYDITYIAAPLVAAVRAHGLPVLTWTVTNAEEERAALAHADEIIYERA
ncbi:MAG: glycerophosphodiester phosphodiesterase [Alphaproteobacteria bacterium]|nr:glycerophosphodiester phosphodiesterase [Alphaproteobacteria bacterium]MDE2341627.1 glycerophosphodiester phosphodiesterase [Alphaproteobacteria bacterium]